MFIEIDSTITCMVEPVSGWVDSKGWGTIDTDCVSITGITKGSGGEFVLSGNCGSAIISLSVLVGSGAQLAVSDGISTACEFTSDGLALAGSRSAVTGICSGKIILIISCMVALVGCWVPIRELVCTSTDSAHWSEITKENGAVYAQSGSCGKRSITSDQTK